MKKSLSKPQHWQDFESLCKKLFGAAWDCRNTIRGNGRSGQEQCGVDVYAIPKGEDEYFGIQCKGKDDYTKAKLTEKEVLDEINKATKFKPKLKVFVIATTANKDANIQTFIRTEDIRSRQNGGFEIQLYAWEDLVDLLEEHDDIYQWYLSGQHIRGQYECTILIDGGPSTTIKPVYTRQITQYVTETWNRAFNNSSLNKMLQLNKGIYFAHPREHKRQFNYSICQIQVSIQNTGNKTLDDWKLSVEFDPSQVKKLCKEYEGEERGYDEMLSVSLMKSIHSHHRPSLTVDEEALSLTYQPADNSVLTQRDNRKFSFWLQPVSHEIQEIHLRWEMLARDFNDRGDISIAVDPVMERDWKHAVLEEGQQKRENESVIFEKVADKRP